MARPIPRADPVTSTEGMRRPYRGCDAGAMTGELVVVERGRRLAFSFEDLLRYHGPGSPGGVAHAFKVLERALPLLEPRGRVRAPRAHRQDRVRRPGRAGRLRAGHARGHRRPLRGRPGAGPAGARAGARALRLPARAPRPRRGARPARGLRHGRVHRPRPHRAARRRAGAPPRRAQARDGRAGHGPAGRRRSTTRRSSPPGEGARRAPIRDPTQTPVSPPVMQVADHRCCPRRRSGARPSRPDRLCTYSPQFV